MITFPVGPAVDQLHTAENGVVYKFDGVSWNTVSGIGTGVWGTVTGTLTDQADLVSALAGKTSTGHAHAISDVTSLQSDLNGKAATSHTHVAANITDFTSEAESIVQADAISTAYVASGTTSLAYQRDAIYYATAATGPTTWAITGLPTTPAISRWTVELVNGGTQTQTWFAGVTWDTGVAPVLTAAGMDILTFYSHATGIIRGFLDAKDIK